MDADIYAMQAFVDTMVGTPKFSYPAKRNNPRPNDEFAEVQLLEEYAVGLPVKRIIEETPEWTRYVVRSASRLRFRIGIVETNGIASTKIMHGWTSEAMLALMFSTGYGFIRCNPIGIEDAKLEKDWERRQGLSVETYVERVYVETIDNITAMQINGSFITEGLDELLVQIEINNL